RRLKALISLWRFSTSLCLAASRMDSNFLFGQRQIVALLQPGFIGPPGEEMRGANTSRRLTAIPVRLRPGGIGWRYEDQDMFVLSFWQIIDDGFQTRPGHKRTV